MTKLFNVVQDMDNMSKDKLKGAIRNMEETSNTLYAAFNEMAKLYDDDHYDVVLTLDPASFPEWVEYFYLPSNSGTVIVNRSNPAQLLDWKLRFFAEYGNLRLESIKSGEGRVVLGVCKSNRNTERFVGWEKYEVDRLQREISSAKLYDSMSNTKL
jgi:hypothetical protein